MTNPEAPPPAPKSQRSQWTTGDYVGLIGGLAGVASGIIAYFSWQEAKESRKIAGEAQTLSQKTYDRAAGRVGAKFVVERVEPTFDDVPRDLKVRSPLKTEEVRLGSLADLRRVNVRVILRNVGDEAIEALRVETKLSLVAFHVPNLGEKEWVALRPWVLKNADRDDIAPGRKIMPGQRVAVQIARGLLPQLLHAQSNGPRDKDHFGQCEIRFYGRLVGTSGFDDAERQAVVMMNFIWDPRGFPAEECKKFLADTQTEVQFVQ